VNRVPLRLWLQLVFGQWLMQMGAVIVGACSLALAFVLPRGPEDPPIWLASFILAIGCFPLFAVAWLRAHRTLRLLQHGREATARKAGKYIEFDLPDGDVQRATLDNPHDKIVYDPQNPTLVANFDDLPTKVPGATVWLALVLPLAAIIGIVVLIVA
jgi:hypothetical protein